MPVICVKLRQREKNKFRKMLSIENELYLPDDLAVSSSTPYVPGAALEDGEWFRITQVSTQEYSIDLLTLPFESVDFEALGRNEIPNIDYLFVDLGDTIIFQKVSRTQLITKKCILCLGESFTYNDNSCSIEINKIPDAIYKKTSDVLYFRKLESITSIFRGIDQLYSEATEAETEQFLSCDFIQLRDGFTACNVKTANRKRIALAMKTLSGLDNNSKHEIFTYIGEYCPNLQKTQSSFEIGSEEDLKFLLYGIEQRFYTTIVGGEKRIANSVIPLIQQ